MTDADRIATARALVLIGQDPVTFNVSLLAEEFARHRIAAEAAKDAAMREAVAQVSNYAFLSGEAVGLLKGWVRYVDGPRGDLTQERMMHVTREFLARVEHK